MLYVNELYKDYGSKEVLKGITFTYGSGIVGIVGKNGSGKTTLIKTILGLIDKKSGEVSIDGERDVINNINIKKNVAYISEEVYLYDKLTGSEYLSLILDIYDVPEEIRKERFDKYIKKFDIEEHLNKPIRYYSHGTKQKLSILATFMRDWNLLILDEPFVGLDIESTLNLKRELKKKVAEGKTILLCTHMLETINSLCTDVIFIKDGKVALSGKVDEITEGRTIPFEDIFLKLVGAEYYE